MNGDLLRTLEGPENCLKPKLIQASREGHCVIFYENGGFCTFSVNGKLQAAVETDDNIRVSAPQTAFWTSAAPQVAEKGGGSLRRPLVRCLRGPVLHTRRRSLGCPWMRLVHLADRSLSRLGRRHARPESSVPETLMGGPGRSFSRRGFLKVL